MEDTIKTVANILAKNRKVVALTGAGISVESGIPPFRGKGGVWEKFDPMEFAYIDSFLRQPEKVWRIFLKDLVSFIDTAQPNDAHLGLARLEELGILKTVITQNVDGLHQKAGNTDVIEFHGTFADFFCLNCEKPYQAGEIDFTSLPPRCPCGGILRPNCVFFGEMIPPKHMWRSRDISSHCDVMLVVGTSAVVQPAASIPVIARKAGAIVVEINPEPTPLTQEVSAFLLQGSAGDIMNRLIDHIHTIKRSEQKK